MSVWSMEVVGPDPGKWAPPHVPAVTGSPLPQIGNPVRSQRTTQSHAGSERDGVTDIWGIMKKKGYDTVIVYVESENLRQCAYDFGLRAGVLTFHLHICFKEGRLGRIWSFSNMPNQASLRSGKIRSLGVFISHNRNFWDLDNKDLLGSLKKRSAYIGGSVNKQKEEEKNAITDNKMSDKDNVEEAYRSRDVKTTISQYKTPEVQLLSKESSIHMVQSATNTRFECTGCGRNN
ncbi:hypothetical protein FQA39_LY10188 [Lamprigera yunnana]|nr:hypothetical protein FQA39_LY10188 [Lamprigera yunnana]